MGSSQRVLCPSQHEERAGYPWASPGGRAGGGGARPPLSVRDRAELPGSAGGRSDRACARRPHRPPPGRARRRGPHSPRPRQPSAPSQLSRTAQNSPSSAGGRSNRCVCTESAPRAPQLPAAAAAAVQAMARVPETRGQAEEGCGAQVSARPRGAVTQPRKSCFHDRGQDGKTRRAEALEGAGPT